MTDTKMCPYCSEEIMAGAKKCKHCGEFIDSTLRTAKEKEQKEVVVKSENSGLVTVLIVLGIIALLSAILGF